MPKMAAYERPISARQQETNEGRRSAAHPGTREGGRSPGRYEGLTVEVVDAENHCERDEDRHVQLADDAPFDGGINLERRDLDVCVARQALLVGGAHRWRGSVSLLLGRRRRMEQRRTEEAKKRRLRVRVGESIRR